MRTESKTAEFLKWLADHPGIQRILCCEEPEMDAQKCIEAMNQLAEQGFYQAVYLLLMQNQPNPAIGNATEKITARLWVSEWGRAGDEQMYKLIKETIQNEINSRNMQLEETSV